MLVSAIPIYQGFNTHCMDRGGRYYNNKFHFDCNSGKVNCKVSTIKIQRLVVALSLHARKYGNTIF
jgi:hypothetical protein